MSAKGYAMPVPPGGSIVPRLGDGKMLRSDVEGWLGEQNKAARKRAEKLQEDTLWWGSCMVLRSRDHCGSNRLFPCTLRWRRDGRSREDLAARMRNEPRRRKGSRERGSGDPFFKALPWLKVIPVAFQVKAARKENAK